MTLKLALLLVGVVIVISVVIGVMDQVRARRKRRKRRRPTGEMVEPKVRLPMGDAVLLDEADAEPPMAANVALEKPTLKTNSPTPQHFSSTSERAFLSEIESYEEVADIRLDVDPEIDRRVMGDDGSVAVDYADIPTVANETIDFIVTLPGRKSIKRNRALGLFKQNEYMLDKPRMIFGLRSVTNVWSNLEIDPEYTEYSDIQLAIQMVDSKGPVGESELNTFMQMGLTFGDKYKRRTLFSREFEEALQLAQDLDAFCRQNDVIATINVVANSPTGFQGRALDATARDIGMRFGDMNIFHRFSPEGRVLFSLANLYKPGEFNPHNWEDFRTNGLTLFMQVPRVPDPVNHFSDMIDFAMHLADRLGGRMVDQDKKPLAESGVHAISAQIEKITRDMRTRGIPPGGEAALRLFRA